MQTIPIENDPDFRELEAHAQKGLLAKGYKLEPRKGSTSWIDPRIKPADNAVRFKLCRYQTGIFFGAREKWANEAGVSLDSIGPATETVKPSLVRFRGEFIRNDGASKRKIDSILALFP